MIRPLLASLMLALALPALAQTPAPQAVPVPASKAKPRVQLMTSYGPIVVELEQELAPKTVANFLGYVQRGHYAGTIFHRVIGGFMIQGGGMMENMEEKPAGEAVLNEAPQTFKAGLKNTRGTIAMARTAMPHSAVAQFYINLVDNVALDHRDMSTEGYGYCAFGRVVAGMDVVDRIAGVKTEWRRGMGDVPQFAVRLKEATVLPAQ
jgi:peptidyl-prolyl cis-trans isomerase B (cyclophilin B)